jgi:hypothetical protein
MSDSPDYMQVFNGYFRGIRSWDDLTQFWNTLRQHNQGQWYVYATHERPPASPLSAAELEEFIQLADKELRDNHEEDYCGIVYVDNPEVPTFVKIYDPNNLGVVCGFSDNPPLPKWVLSQIQPVDIEAATTPPSRWKKLLHRFT